MTSAGVEAWFAKAEADEQDAGFAARVTENQRRVFQIAYGVLGTAAEAEEVAQEAFLHAYRKFHSLREPQKFRAWVNRITFRLALNRQRAGRRRTVRDAAWHAECVPTVVDGENSAEQRVLIEQLRAEISRLPERLRAVLLLSVVQDMDAEDVGAVLGIPAGTVRSRLHAAKKLLLEAMT